MTPFGPGHGTTPDPKGGLSHASYASRYRFIASMYRSHSSGSIVQLFDEADLPEEEPPEHPVAGQQVQLALFN